VNRRNQRVRRTSIRRKIVKTKPSSPQKSKTFNIKQSLSSLFVWLLVVINVILIASMVHKLITPRSIPDGNIALNQDPIKISVWNGRGITGLANEFAEFLKREGFDVVEVTNADRFDFERSIIIDRGRRDLKQIEKLCDLLGINKDQIRTIAADDIQTDVTFIIGADYSNLRSYQSMH